MKLKEINREILKNSYYYKCDDELIKLCIDNDNFLLLKLFIFQKL